MDHTSALTMSVSGETLPHRRSPLSALATLASTLRSIPEHTLRRSGKSAAVTL